MSSQSSQKFRVRVWTSYGTHTSSGYCGTGVQNSQKVRAGTKKNVVPVSRVLWREHPVLTYRSSGYGYMNIVDNSHKFFVG